MKFLLVSPFTSASGSSVRFWNIARALGDRGHTVVLAERRANGAPPLHRCGGITYCSCPSTGALFPDMAISLVFYLVLFMRYIGCDVFYVLKPAPNNGIPALAAKLIGKRVLLDVDDLDYAYLKPGFGRTVFRWFFDTLPRMFDLVTYHTPRLEQYLREEAGVPSEKLYYYAQGISPEFLSVNLPAADAVPLKSVIYAATLGQTSDFADLIPSFGALCRKHPDLSVTVAGDGIRRRLFEELVAAEEIGGNVTFTGSVPHGELPGIMARHRIGINYMRPTTVNRCRAILKIREYLACGLTVVCNDVGDVDLFREYISVGTTVGEMFVTLAALLDSPPEVNRSGRDHIVGGYQWSILTGAFLDRISAR